MGRDAPKMGHTAHAARSNRCDSGGVSFLSALLLVWSLLLVAGMVFGVAGPLAAPARKR
jgi:hypothetical protein